MSRKKWTQEQLQAITARDCNTLVSAAAGAGKTAVLVERIIRKVTDETNPVDIDKLLVVTFTKSAAAEMRERIGAAIARELNNNPESHHLNRQLTLLNRASITTLHSFCLEVVRQYFYRIDLDPSFRVADDAEAVLLRSEVLEELFEDGYASGNPDFLTLVDAFGGDRGDDYLQEMVLRLFDFARSMPWPERWLEQLAERYRFPEGFPLEQAPWGNTVMRWVELQLQGCLSKLERAVKLAESPGGPFIYRESLIDGRGLIKNMASACDRSWLELYNLFGAMQFSTLRACRDRETDETLKNEVKRLRDEVKSCVNDIRQEFFSRPPSELLADLNKMAPMVQTLSRLVTEFAKRYGEAKAARALVDFSDLEHYCLNVLMEPESSPDRLVASTVACELRDYFAEVLVDEYQDINGVQEVILQLVSRQGSGSPNLFMVGDVKQSIYRFRLADPTLFLEKYINYPREDGMSDRGIDLTKNFRSRREIINAVNFVFRQLMTGRIGEITYDGRAELACGAHYPGDSQNRWNYPGCVELHLLDKNPAAADGFLDGDNVSGIEDDIIELDSFQREARVVARRIKEMVTSGEDGTGPEFSIYDTRLNDYRPVQFRDIVVLLRTTRNTANIFMEEFRRLGIPSYADLNTGYFEAIEVDAILSLLKVLDNPRQDIPLAALLRSPIVGLNAEELANVRLRDKDGDFYDAVRKSAELQENDIDKKLRWLLDRLEKWRTMARQEPLSDLIWRVYNETGFYAYAGGMPGGTQRQANLRALYDRARQYERTDFKGLFRFLRFLERFKESGTDLGTARALGENENVVRILSVHKSKGLEFPVVIVAGLGRQFNFNDLRQKAVFHKELGLGLPVIDLDLHLTYPSLAHSAIKKQLHLDLLSEELRILYVALTRAREKLVLVGSVHDLEKSAARWCQNIDCQGWSLPDTDLASAKTYLDWICPSLARHPHGMPIRELARAEISPEKALDDPSDWVVCVPTVDRSLVEAHKSTEDNEQLLESVRHFRPVEVGGMYTELIDKLLNWQYPFTNMVGKPAKISVTELKRRFHDETVDEESFSPYSAFVAKRPRFLQPSTGLTAAEKGTTMHLVMQNIKLDGDLTEEGITGQLTEMVESELLTKEQFQSVDVRAIAGFFSSPLGIKVLNSENVKREVPFTLAISAGEIFKDLGSGTEDKILVQGVIDCIIDEGDGFVIIDYKTDTIGTETAEEILNRYRGQLDLYSTAVEKIFQKPVKERYLYLFAAGKEVSYP